MRVLVVNAGSSSLKLRVHDGPAGADAGRPAARRDVEDWDGEDVRPVTEILDTAGPVDAVGHRVVHGGTGRSGPALVDDRLVGELEALEPLAPLHQRRSLAGIAAARTAAPDVGHVACFDTAYHTTLPDAAATYPLPAAWRQRWPLRRYGFHGLSHAYAARRVERTTDPARPHRRRIVTCHLGAGASLCASLDGRSVDTTMGFTPLEGLVMATRSGSVDPGLVLWLVTEAGMTAEEVREQMEHASGLAGLAGTGDMRTVLDRRRSGDGTAAAAFDVYIHVLAREVAAMTPALGGLDALVFTGGVGEGAPDVRAAAAERLGHLGVMVDPRRNETALGPGDHDITAPGAPVTTLVVEAREDLEICRLVSQVLDGRPPPTAGRTKDLREL